MSTVIAETVRLLAWYERHKPVMEAFAKGEEIQGYASGEWRDSVNPWWMASNEYRVKPKPYGTWAIVWEIKNGERQHVSFRTLERAKQALNYRSEKHEPYNNGRVVYLEETLMLDK